MLSDKKLLFSSENIKAQTLVSDITNLQANINFDTSQNLSKSNINEKYNGIIKNLLFYSNDIINLPELAIVLDNLRIESIYDVMPDISHSSSSHHNVANISLNSDGTTFSGNNPLVLSGDFSIKFANMNKTYRIKNSSNITNYSIFIYHLPNEIISIIETDVNNITYEAFNTEEILSHKLVNLITLEELNTNLVVIDGTSIEPIYNNLPKLTIQNAASNNIVRILRNSYNVQFNYSENIFNNNFSIKFTNLGQSYKIPINNTSINNLIIYVYNLYNETITFENYNAEDDDIFVTSSLILNNFINLQNNITENYNLLVIDGMYLYNSTSSQPQIEKIFNKQSIDLDGNNHEINIINDCSLSSIIKI